MDNLSAGLMLHPFGTDSTGNINHRPISLLNSSNEISGVKVDKPTGGRRRKVSGKQVFLRRRILLTCSLRWAIKGEYASATQTLTDYSGGR